MERSTLTILGSWVTRIACVIVIVDNHSPYYLVVTL
jgi:hypothetical protein